MTNPFQILTTMLICYPFFLILIFMPPCLEIWHTVRFVVLGVKFHSSTPLKAAHVLHETKNGLGFSFLDNVGRSHFRKVSPVGIHMLKSERVSIVDDLLPEEAVKSLNPGVNLAVSWKSVTLGVGTSGDRFDFDGKIAKHAPQVQFTPKMDSTSESYCVLMVDPDAPYGKGSADTYEYLHWLAADITGKVAGSDDAAIVPYVGPSLPQRSNLHRYVLLLLKNGEDTPTAPDLKGIPTPRATKAGEEIKMERSHFNTREFLKMNKFTVEAVEFFIVYP